jgi:hypothetical protein
VFDSHLVRRQHGFGKAVLVANREVAEAIHYHEVMDTIDTIHLVEKAKPAIVIFTNLSGRTNGKTSVDKSGKAKIRLDPEGPRKSFSFTHELGHLLDLNLGTMVETRLGKPCFRPATRVYSHPGFLEYRDNDLSRRIQDLIQCILSSNAYDSLKEKLIKTEALRPFVLVDKLNRIRYFLRESELFARAYSQFVASQGQSALLKSQLEERLEIQRRNPDEFQSQWEHNDFAPILQAFQELLKEKGWLL